MTRRQLSHPKLARILRAIENDTSTGFCLSCGAERDGVEPDARQYPCPQCDALAVYGAAEILLMKGPR